MLKNFSKHISLVFLLALGFFLMPSVGYACAKKSVKIEQTSCSKDQSKKAEQKECCKTKTCKKNKNHNDCNGKCKHSSCSCSTASSSFSLPIPIDLRTKNHFAKIKKQRFDFKQANYSSCYFSIWLPPKIA